MIYRKGAFAGGSRDSTGVGWQISKGELNFQIFKVIFVFVLFFICFGFFWFYFL